MVDSCERNVPGLRRRSPVPLLGGLGDGGLVSMFLVLADRQE